MAAKPRAGVIGLGIIGSRVAARLAHAGFPLAVWSRSPKVLPGLPPAAENLPSLAGQADILQVFVSDDAALRETVGKLLPSLQSGHVILCHATVAPESVRAAADLVAARGAAFLDAPFTGSRDAAAQGQITYYIGGEAAVLERAKPALEASAKAIILLGGIGAASAVKIATNIMAAAAAVSLAEAICLLRNNGVDPAVLPSVLENNAARSGVTDLKLPCMLAEDFAPRFSAKNMLKDMRLARQLLGQDEKTITTTMERLYGETCRRGSGEEDFAAVLKTLEA
jgi:3-hydroxyisobutyrate dehydrogenase-like beta-hydroxyacid dehydrogenase